MKLNTFRKLSAVITMVSLSLTAPSNSPADAATAGTAIVAQIKPELPVSTIIERGPHHRVWQTVRAVPIGLKTVQKISTYTELATGMHYAKDGRWVESKAVIELLPDGTGAVARQGQHTVRFAANLNTSGAIDLTSPEGKRFQSSPLGLAYHDGNSGKIVVIASLKDSIGRLVGENQVLYPDAFDSLSADVRFTYSIYGLEQDVILLEAPASPSEYGLDPKSTRLEIVTSFVNAPTPSKETTVLQSQADLALRQTMAEPDLTDESLQFGDMAIGPGMAFLLPQQDGLETDSGGVQMGKSWIQSQGVNFLIEKVDYSAIRPHLATLKTAAVKSDARKSLIPKGGTPMLAGLFPTAANPAVRGAVMRVAAAEANRRGFLLDYSQVVSGSSNFVFKGDSTYIVAGTVNLYGTTTIEGGTVVKYTNFSAIPSLTIQGPIDCKTFPLRPAVFTAKDDDSVGEQIAGSTNNPANNTYYAYFAFRISDTTSSYDFHDLRISHAYQAFYRSSGTNAITLSNVQLQDCYRAFGCYYSPISLRNALLNRVRIGYYSFVTNSAENVTFHNLQYFLSASNTAVPALTNCLLISVTNFVSYTGANVATNLDSTGVFQTVGGASHYLPPDSIYRGMATANVNADLAAALKTKTTWPPIVYSNAAFSDPTTFSPQAPRDTNITDLGFHYETLDYAFGGTDGNADLTFAPGTAVGWFRTSSGWYHAGHGIHMADQKILTFDGRADAPDYWVRCSVLQEGGTGLWDGGFGPGGITGWADQDLEDIALSPEVRARFTRFSMLAGDGNHFRDDSGYLIVRATDCEFYSGGAGGYVLSCYFTNCLMERFYAAQMAGLPGNEVDFRNCTWHGGLFQLNRYYSTPPIPISVRDTAFDGTAFDVANDYTNNPANLDYDYNAFLSAAQYTTPPGVHDVLVTDFNWQSLLVGSSLWNYYVGSSDLVDHGSQGADLAGLFHFTTGTNQVKELNSMVDIGYHHVALDPGLSPVDSDGDIIADYVEDWNGNGIREGSETSFTSSDTDQDGLSDYEELYVLHTDPNNAYSLSFYVPDGFYLGGAVSGFNVTPVSLSAPHFVGNNVTFTLTGASGPWSLYFEPTASSPPKWMKVATILDPAMGFSIPNPGGPGGYFAAFSAADQDSDGVTDGDEYMILGSHYVASPDSDNDGHWDGQDAFPLDPAAWVDTDGDGKPDFLTKASTSVPPLVVDEDSDNDGIPDNVEMDAGSNWQDANSLPLPKWYVDHSAGPAGDGSKALPFQTIQAAITMAGNYDIIQVANGTYSGAGNRDLDFAGKNFQLRSLKGFENTTIDLAGGTSGLTFQSGNNSNFTWLVGFTIMNCPSSAIVCNSGSRPVIFDCVFANNAAGASTANGGGVNCNGSRPTIINCKFLRNGNTTGEGGGIYVSGNSQPIIANCTFLDNTRAANGGQIYAKDQSTVIFNSCIVWTTAVGSDAEVKAISPASVLRDWCDIKGSLLGDGHYLIASDPLLESTGRLTVNSPCIDHALTNGAPGFSHLTGLDADGEARLQILPPNLLYPASADIGADEYVYRLTLPLVQDETTGTGDNVYSFIDEASGVAFLGESGGVSKIAIIDDEVRTTNFILKIDGAGQYAGYDAVPWAAEMNDMEEVTYDPVGHNAYMITSQTKRNRYVRSDHDQYPWQDPPTNDYDDSRNKVATIHLNAADLTWDGVAPIFWTSETKSAPASIDFDAVNGFIPYIRTQVAPLAALNDQILGDNVMIAYNTVNKFSDPRDGQRYGKGDRLDPNCANCGTSLGDTVTGTELGTTIEKGYHVFTLLNSYQPLQPLTKYYFKIWAFNGAERLYSRCLPLITSNVTASLPTVSVIPKLFINELDAQANPDWIEIYNPGRAAVNIAGYKIRLLSAALPFVLPNTLPVVPAHDFLVLNCNNCNACGVVADLNFSLPDTAQDGVRLMYSDNPGQDGTKIDDYIFAGTGPSEGRVWDGGEGGGKFSSGTAHHPKTKGTANNDAVVNGAPPYKYFDATSDIDQATPKIYLTWKNIGQLPAVWKYSPKQQDSYPISIEGFAYRGGAAPEMMIGLRSPLTSRSTGNAIYFRANPIGNFLPAGGGWNAVAGGLSGLREINLNGQGVRSISWYSAHNTYLIIGGPANGGPLTKELFNEKFSLYSWNGLPGANGPDGFPTATPLKIIDDLRVYAVRPEGVAVMTINGVERVVLVEDRYHQKGYGARNVIHWPISVLGTAFQSAQ